MRRLRALWCWIRRHPMGPVPPGDDVMWSCQCGHNQWRIQRYFKTPMFGTVGRRMERIK